MRLRALNDFKLTGSTPPPAQANGLDDKKRIIGAKGKRPFIKNVGAEHVRVFREQVELVTMIGEHGIGKIAEAVQNLHGCGTPAFSGAVSDVAVETVRAKEPQFYKSDPAGFLVVYPNRQAKTLVVEHYTTNGVLGCVVEGKTPTAVYGEVVKRGLVSQFDHAAYLGRELATAERSLQTGEPYVQDRAPGKPMPAPTPTVVSDCVPSCTTCH